MKNFFIIILLCCYSLTYSQGTYTFPKDSLPSISITGTSTLHGWTVTAGEIMDFPDELAINFIEGQTIDSFSFTVQVASLDGGRGASMNGKIQSALQATSSPTIEFRQTQPAVITNSEGQWVLNSTGILSMAGKEKTVSVDVQLEQMEGGVSFKGSKDLKMSDYEMKPPSAMFGQIQTDDAITVHFEFNYYK